MSVAFPAKVNIPSSFQFLKKPISNDSENPFEITRFLAENPLPRGASFSTAHRAWADLTKGSNGHFNAQEASGMEKEVFKFFKDVRHIYKGGQNVKLDDLGADLQKIYESTPKFTADSNLYQILKTAHREAKNAFKQSNNKTVGMDRLVFFLGSKMNELTPTQERKEELDKTPFRTTKMIDQLRQANQGSGGSFFTLSLAKKLLLATTFLLLIGRNGVSISSQGCSLSPLRSVQSWRPPVSVYNPFHEAALRLDPQSSQPQSSVPAHDPFVEAAPRTKVEPRSSQPQSSVPAHDPFVEAAPRTKVEPQSSQPQSSVPAHDPFVEAAPRTKVEPQSSQPQSSVLAHDPFVEAAPRTKVEPRSSQPQSSVPAHDPFVKAAQKQGLVSAPASKKTGHVREPIPSDSPMKGQKKRKIRSAR